MPVIQGELSQAYRVIRGDTSLTPGTDVNGFDTNVEFQKIYFGNDLKFDRLAGSYLCIRNTGTRDISFSVTRYRTNSSSYIDEPGLFIVQQNADSSYTADAAVSYGTVYTISPGRLIGLRNYHVNSVNGGTNNVGLSYDKNNYIHFSVYSTGNTGTGACEITGKWSALASAIKHSETDGFVPQYCFYSLFSGAFNGIDTVTSKAELWDGQTDLEAKAHAFESMFEASGITGWDTRRKETFTHCGEAAFYAMFAASSISKAMSVYVKNSIDGASSGGNGVFEAMYAGCTAMTVAPSLCKAPTGAWDDYAMFTDISCAYKQTFEDCTSIISPPPGYLNYTSPSDRTVVVGYQSLSHTFFGCYNLRYPLSCMQNYLPIPETVIYVETEGMDSTYRGCASLRYPMFCVYGNGSDVPQEVGHSMKGIAPIYDIGTSSKALCKTYLGCTSITSSDYYESREDKYYAGAKKMRFIGNGAYQGLYSMFESCTSLTDMSGIFDGITAGEQEFGRMFYGCTSLTSASIDGIYGNSSANDCFYEMFRGCISMTSCLGSVPYTGTYGCSGMFYGCSSLVSSPYLSMETLPTGVYSNMFYGCSSLKIIITNQSQQGSGTSNWTYGVPNGGTGANARYYVKLNSSNTGTTQNSSGNTSNAHYIPYNWQVLSEFLVFSSKVDYKIKLQMIGNPTAKTVRYINMSDSTPTLQIFNNHTYNSWIQCSAFKQFFIQAESTDDNSFSTGPSDYYKFDIYTEGQEFDGTNGVSCIGNLSALVRTTSPPLNMTREYTFYKLFHNCSKLSSCPDLCYINYSRSGGHNYEYAFSGTSISFIPSNPLTGVKERDFSHAFSNTLCNSAGAFSLANVTVIGPGAFEYMFAGCTNFGSFNDELTKLPASSVSLSEACFANMYDGCTSITRIPENYLPWMNLARECYKEMFRGCTSLTDVPKDLLPAISLGPTTILCYYGMFCNCTSLRKGPKLPASGTITDGPYLRIFAGCVNLDEIEVGFTDWGDAWLNQTQRNTADWVLGVTNTNGVFKCPAGLANNFNNSGNTSNSVAGQTVSDSSACYIPYDWTVVQPAVIPSDRLTFTRVSGTTTLKVPDAINSYSGVANQYQWSTDGTTWTNLTSDVSISSSRTKVCIRLKPGTTADQDNAYFTMTGSGTVNVSGNLAWLVSSTGVASYVYIRNSFHGCPNIRDCSGLYFQGNPHVDVSRMFWNTGITAINKTLLRYVIVDDASWMFKDCSSLATGADLVCYNDYIYGETFKEVYDGCSSLQSPDNDELCIHIGSTATHTPQIGTRAFCYAFNGCNAPSFNKIDIDMCELGNWGSYQWDHAFNGCSNLSKVRTTFKRWPAATCTQWWLNGVSSSGTFYMRAQSVGGPSSETHGYANIPINWNVIRIYPDYTCS